MEVLSTRIEGVKLIIPHGFGAPRGWFVQQQKGQILLSCMKSTLTPAALQRSAFKGVVRGHHRQAAPHTQAKLACVIRGTVCDISINIRKYSPAFGKYDAEVLTGESKKQFYIHRGYAHDFVVLEDNAPFSHMYDNICSLETFEGYCK